MSEELAKEIIGLVAGVGARCDPKTNKMLIEEITEKLEARDRQEFNRGVEACAEKAAKCLTDDGKILAGKLRKLKKPD